MVDVQVSSLSAFKKNILPRSDSLVDFQGNIRNIFFKNLTHGEIIIADRLKLQWVRIQELCEIKILFFEVCLDLFFQGFRFKQINSTNPRSAGFVLVTMNESTTRGTDFVLTLCHLPGQVNGIMIRHDEMCPFTQ